MPANSAVKPGDIVVLARGVDRFAATVLSVVPQGDGTYTGTDGEPALTVAYVRNAAFLNQQNWYDSFTRVSPVYHASHANPSSGLSAVAWLDILEIPVEEDTFENDSDAEAVIKADNDGTIAKVASFNAALASTAYNALSEETDGKDGDPAHTRTTTDAYRKNTITESEPYQQTVTTAKPADIPLTHDTAQENPAAAEKLATAAQDEAHTGAPSAAYTSGGVPNGDDASIFTPALALDPKDILLEPGADTAQPALQGEVPKEDLPGQSEISGVAGFSDTAPATFAVGDAVTLDLGGKLGTRQATVLSTTPPADVPEGAVQVEWQEEDNADYLWVSTDMLKPAGADKKKGKK